MDKYFVGDGLRSILGFPTEPKRRTYKQQPAAPRRSVERKANIGKGLEALIGSDNNKKEKK